MKIWIDDVRPAPKGYQWCKSVNEAMKLMCSEQHLCLLFKIPLEVILDLDHDAGDYKDEGGDYIEILNIIEKANRYCEEHDSPRYTFIIPTVHLHSMNPVGVQNMRAIIEHNGWKEI